MIRVLCREVVGACARRHNRIASVCRPFAQLFANRSVASHACPSGGCPRTLRHCAACAGIGRFVRCHLRGCSFRRCSAQSQRARATSLRTRPVHPPPAQAQLRHRPMLVSREVQRRRRSPEHRAPRARAPRPTRLQPTAARAHLPRRAARAHLRRRAVQAQLAWQATLQRRPEQVGTPQRSRAMTCSSRRRARTQTLAPKTCRSRA